MPGIERVILVIVEIDVAVGAREYRLILAVALRVEARLERVRADDLRDVVNEVEGVVLIDERQPVEIYGRERLVVDAAETEVRQVAEADARKQFRDVEVVGFGQRLVIGGGQANTIVARPDDKLFWLPWGLRLLKG